MFYMLKPNVLFRQYGDIGYLTDNALFGYRMRGDEELYPGERYVSNSGAMMLRMLNKEPKCADAVIQELCHIYVGVERDTLEQDVTEFYDVLVNEGFLSRGITYDECVATARRSRSKNFCESNIHYHPNIDCVKSGMVQTETLKGIHIELATECNERCVHCYIPHKYKIKKIDAELVNRILDEAKDLNVLNVTLSGGEPLLHDDFLKILQKCRHLDFSVNVLSNLTLLTDAMIDEMKQNPLLSVQTSIYSMTSNIHDAITGVRGSFNKTMVSFEKLRSIGIPLQISCPVMQENKNTFADVVSFGESNGIQVATDFVVFASLDHNRSNLQCRLSIDDICKAFGLRANDSYVSNIRNLANEKECLSSQEPICSVCRYYICVSANGTAYPCPGWQNKVIGDLNKQTIKEIWDNSRCVQELRSIKRDNFSNCTQCADRGFCNICMMANSNENKDGNAFKVDAFHCQVAKALHRQVDDYIRGRN